VCVIVWAALLFLKPVMTSVVRMSSPRHGRQHRHQTHLLKPLVASSIACASEAAISVSSEKRERVHTSVVCFFVAFGTLCKCLFLHFS
jgi:hypothetical protein